MKEKSIVLKTEEVKELAQEGKVTIKRKIKPEIKSQSTGRWTYSPFEEKHYYRTIDKNGNIFADRGRETEIFNGRCPCGLPGTKLWVKETWWIGNFVDEELNTIEKGYVIFKADEPNIPSWPDFIYIWKSSIHMPREASRFTVTVEKVTIEEHDGVYFWVVELKLEEATSND